MRSSPLRVDVVSEQPLFVFEHPAGNAWWVDGEEVDVVLWLCDGPGWLPSHLGPATVRLSGKGDQTLLRLDPCPGGLPVAARSMRAADFAGQHRGMDGCEARFRPGGDPRVEVELVRGVATGDRVPGRGRLVATAPARPDGPAFDLGAALTEAGEAASPRTGAVITVVSCPTSADGTLIHRVLIDNAEAGRPAVSA